MSELTLEQEVARDLIRQAGLCRVCSRVLEVPPEPKAKALTERSFGSWQDMLGGWQVGLNLEHVTHLADRIRNQWRKLPEVDRCICKVCIDPRTGGVSVAALCGVGLRVVDARSEYEIASRAPIRQVLPMSSNGQAIQRGHSATITTRPQGGAFRIDRIMIAAAGTAHGAADWTVQDVRVGRRSQFAQPGGIPGDLFASGALEIGCLVERVSVKHEYDFDDYQADEDDDTNAEHRRARQAYADLNFENRINEPLPPPFFYEHDRRTPVNRWEPDGYMPEWLAAAAKKPKTKSRRRRSRRRGKVKVS